MCRMKTVAVLLLLTLGLVQQSQGMSEQQMQAATKMVRNVCQPKNKATNEQIDKMHAGDWNIERPTMCYMGCVVSMFKLLDKENKFDYPSGMAQLKTLPEPRRAPTLECMEKCKDAIKTLNDKCVAGFELTKCIYDCNPQNYFLP